MNFLTIYPIKLPAFYSFFNRHDFDFQFAEFDLVRSDFEIALEFLFFDFCEFLLLGLHFFLLFALAFIDHLDHLEFVAFILLQTVFEVDDEVSASFHLSVVQPLGFALFFEPLLDALHEFLHPVLLDEQLLVEPEQKHHVVEVVVGGHFGLADEELQLRDDFLQPEFLLETVRGDFVLAYNVDEGVEIGLDEIIQSHP